MKFTTALLVASTQAISIRYNIHGDLPWNPPAIEKAQNVYHDAPVNREGQPAILDVVHTTGGIESN